MGKTYPQKGAPGGASGCARVKSGCIFPILRRQVGTHVARRRFVLTCVHALFSDDPCEAQCNLMLAQRKHGRGGSDDIAIG
jgi:hypothetical protein